MAAFRRRLRHAASHAGIAAETRLSDRKPGEGIDVLGLVVDRIAGDQTADVMPGNAGLFSNGPTVVVQSNGRTLAGL